MEKNIKGTEEHNYFKKYHQKSENGKQLYKTPKRKKVHKI